jgi:hypothetical protein
VIDERGGALVLEGCAAGSTLRPGKPGEFVTGDDGLTLRFGGAGADVDGFIYWSPALRGIPFKRVEEARQ